MQRLDDGVTCPCCDQYAKRYRRKLSSLMARWLIALVHASPNNEWVHARDVFARIPKRGSNANDYCYLERWGLIEPAPEGVEVKPGPGRKPGRNGAWRPTQLGRDFVNGRAFVRHKVVMYAGVAEGFDGGHISIVDALGQGFDYMELMRPA